MGKRSSPWSAPIRSYENALHFDASVLEFYAPLLTRGGVGNGKAGGIRQQLPGRYNQEAGITVLQVVPTMLRALLQEREISECRSLRRYSAEAKRSALNYKGGSRKCSARACTTYTGRLNRYRLHFGTCEMKAALKRFPSEDRLPTSAIYILDDALREVPIGLPENSLSPAKVWPEATMAIRH